LCNCHFGSNKKGKEGNIKFRKLGNGGKIIRESGETYGKKGGQLSKEFAIKNLLNWTKLATSF
jgi:hypothetical protein